MHQSIFTGSAPWLLAVSIASTVQSVEAAPLFPPAHLISTAAFAAAELPATQPVVVPWYLVAQPRPRVVVEREAIAAGPAVAAVAIKPWYRGAD